MEAPQDYARRERARQLALIVDEFRQNGRCDAHLMWARHGISRTATYVWALRKRGWNIQTIREPGEMAVYHLIGVPDFDAPLAASPARAWRCNNCDTPAAKKAVQAVTSRQGRAECPKCERERLVTYR